MSDDERIERALKSIGDAYVRENPPNYPAFREGVMRRQRRRRWFQAGSAVALAGATVAIGLFFSRSAPLDKPIPPAGRNAENAITDSVLVGDTPSQINIGGDAVWVTSKSGTVTRIDPKTKKPLTRRVGGLPTDLAVGGNKVWIANNGDLQRLNRDGSGDVESYSIAPTGSRMHVSIAPGAVWVVVTGEEIFKVDPRTGSETSFASVQNPVDIAVDEGVLWALEETGRIQGYDADTGKPMGDAIAVSTGNNAEITLGSGALWYGVKGTTELVRIDLETGQSRSIELASDYVDMGVGQGEVWVLMDGTEASGTFASADPDTGRLSAEVHEIEGSPVDIAVGKQALWIVNSVDNHALRIQKSLLNS